MRNALLVLACLLCGCDPFVAEIDEPNLCTTVTGVSFAGSSADQSSTASLPMDLSLSDALAQDGVQGEAHLHSVTLVARSGIEDFRFVRSSHLAAQSHGATESRALQVNGAAGGEEGTLTISGDESDVWSEIRGGGWDLEIALAGNPPSSTWTADVTVCMGVHASAHYIH